MIRKRGLQKKHEKVRRKRRTTIHENKKFDELIIRRRRQEEETSEEENASGGVSRTRKRQECPLGEAPGGACYRRTLQEKEAPGGNGSKYKTPGDGGSMRRL